MSQTNTTAASSAPAASGIRPRPETDELEPEGPTTTDHTGTPGPSDDQTPEGPTTTDHVGTMGSTDEPPTAGTTPTPRGGTTAPRRP
jgi:hypothetical protein